MSDWKSMTVTEAFSALGSLIARLASRIADGLRALASRIGGKLPQKKKAADTMTVLAIDMRRRALHYYTVLGEDGAAISHSVKNYAGGHFDIDFYVKLREALAAFAADTPFEGVRKVSFVVPDEAVAHDSLRLPTMRSPKHLANALDVKLSELYANRDGLEILTYQAEKNKQYSAYGIAAIQKSILGELRAACSENGMLVTSLTYASASTVAAVSALTPKWKNESYLFLDVKDIYSRFIFVVGGRAVGYYTLPFGLEFLSEPKYVQEDMLFDHTLAELTVLNAREKARSRKLSVLAELSDSAEIDENASPADDGSAAESGERSDGGVKVMQKKQPRKLPQFMLRPIPETEEGIARENFRVFVKWALSLLRTNAALTAGGAPKFVAVNLPESLAFVIDALRAEEKENGIPFVRFDGADSDESIAQNLELYGGLHAGSWHSSERF